LREQIRNAGNFPAGHFYSPIPTSAEVKARVNSLKPGDELPSTRTLSADMKVNPMTVSKAYNLLERVGVVERRPGLPVLVAQAGAAQASTRKLDRLRHALKPIAVTIRQLDIDPEDALTVLEDLLDTAPKRKGLRR
jgi:GntR family transcriptional regulator